MFWEGKRGVFQLQGTAYMIKTPLSFILDDNRTWKKGFWVHNGKSSLDETQYIF